MDFSPGVLILCSLLCSVAGQVPVVSVEPRVATVRQGESVSLRCQVKSGAQPVQLEWKRGNNQSLPDNVKIDPDGSVLTLANTQPESQGPYQCVGVNAAGRGTATATLNVKHAPKVQLTPAGPLEPGAPVASAPVASVSTTDITVVEGRTVTVECQATGSPPPVITWSKLRAPLPLNHTVAGGVLTLTSVGRQDSGQYICNATNIHGYSKAYTQIEVESPPYATTLPDQVKLQPGDALHLQCLAQGSHPIQYEWSRAGRATLPPAAQTTKDGKLLIGRVKLGDSGTYKCVATNHIGTSEATAKVTIKA